MPNLVAMTLNGPCANRQFNGGSWCYSRVGVAPAAGDDVCECIYGYAWREQKAWRQGGVIFCLQMCDGILLCRGHCTCC